jgi:threonine/homoserine/homoserine lactone efflux protein
VTPSASISLAISVHWGSRIGFEILKIFGAAAAFWIGLNQYRKSEAWKRLESVSAEMKAFYDDAARKLALG